MTSEISLAIEPRLIVGLIRVSWSSKFSYTYNRGDRGAVSMKVYYYCNYYTGFIYTYNRGDRVTKFYLSRFH